jgi:hypothetical protein
VVCLNVLFNNATIIGEIERRRPAPAVGETAFLEGTSISIRITDNGEPGTLDRANFDYPAHPCAFEPGDLPITQGNYIAHYDPPLELLSGLDLLLAEFEAAAGDH